MKPRLQLPARYTQPLTAKFPTDGDKLIKLVEGFMVTEESEGKPLTLDPWQKWLLRAILERYPDDWHDQSLAGRLRYRQVVVSLGRQNGKSTVTQALSLFALLMHEAGPTVIGLASSLDQAKIVYNRSLFTVNNNPWLKKRFKKATEHRGMHLADGSGTYMVKAAKESSVQGISVSFGIIDELHIIPTGLFSALTLGTSTRKDGMVIGITTAGDQSSETLLDLYKTGGKAVAGDKEFERFGFFCWEAPAGCAIDDPEAIYAANPAVAAGRIPLERVITDVRTIPEHEARRYRLNQFLTSSANTWLPAELFKKAAGGGISNITGSVLAVDWTNNREYATIAAANQNGDTTETELVASIVSPSEDQLFNKIVQLYQKHHCRAVALDDRMMPNLGKRLKQAGVITHQLWTKEITAACSNAYALFSSGKIVHKNDPLLVMQSANGVPRYNRDTWLIDRKESLGNIDALLATIMAVYVSNTARHASVQVF